MAGHGTHYENCGDKLHGVRCSDETRPEFMLTMSPPEVAHIEEGIGVPADRCRFGRFDQIYGDVRCPDA
jgi:hypothetical protein